MCWAGHHAGTQLQHYGLHGRPPCRGSTCGAYTPIAQGTPLIIGFGWRPSQHSRPRSGQSLSALWRCCSTSAATQFTALCSRALGMYGTICRLQDLSDGVEYGTGSATQFRTALAGSGSRGARRWCCCSAASLPWAQARARWEQACRDGAAGKSLPDAAAARCA